MKKQLVITGASSGIGYHTAALFLQKGWNVLNLSRRSCDLQGVDNIAIDFSDSTSWQSVKEYSEANFTKGQLCLIHNAATYYQDSVDKMDLEKFQRCLEVNLLAPIALNQLFIPLMDKGSSILYVGSTLSEKAVSGAASYVITKHALAGLMKASCQDLAGSGIHTSCVCPGFTDTKMLRQHLNNDEEILASLACNNAAGRLVSPEEIANTLLFCADNPVINGEVLHVNLGQLER